MPQRQRLLTKVPKRIPGTRLVKPITSQSKKLYVPTDELAKPLTERQSRFLEHYFKSKNATEAFVEAWPDYAAEWPTADAKRRTYFRVAATRFLHSPRVWARVEEANKIADNIVVEAAQRYAVRHGISKQRIVDELAKIAFADPRNVMKWDGDKFAIVPSSELDDASAASISGVKVVKGKTIERKDSTEITPDLIVPEMHNKREALMELAKLLGYTETEDKGKPQVAVQFVIEK